MRGGALLAQHYITMHMRSNAQHYPIPPLRKSEKGMNISTMNKIEIVGDKIDIEVKIV